MYLNHNCIKSVMEYLVSKLTYVDERKFTHNTISLNDLFKALPDYSSTDICYTVEQLASAGYLSIKVLGNSHVVKDITWLGHQYMEAKGFNTGS